MPRVNQNGRAILDVYVAGRTHDIRRVRQVQNMCRSVGWNITFDWTTTKEEGGEGGIRRDWRDEPELAREIAVKEYHACRSADLGIWLWGEGALGAAFESAWIMESGELWIVECERDSIFFYLHDDIRRFENILDVFSEIRMRDHDLNSPSTQIVRAPSV
jgi:hypothetical protein